MIISALLATSLLAQAAAKHELSIDGDAVVGTREFAGASVKFRLEVPSPQGTLIDGANGRSIALLPDGTISPPFNGKGGAADFLAQWKTARASGKQERRLKFIIRTSADEFADGNHQNPFRRGWLDEEWLTKVNSQIIKFVTMAEAATGEPITARTMIDKGTIFQAQPGWLKEYAEPRVNQAPFDADGRADKDPFDAVFVIQPMLTPNRELAFIGRIPVALIGFFTEGAGNHDSGVANAMCSAYATMLSASVQQDAMGLTPPTNWAAMSLMSLSEGERSARPSQPLTTAAYRANQDLYSAVQTKESLATKVPGFLFDSDGSTIHLTKDSGGMGLDSVILPNESMGFSANHDGAFLFIDSEVYPFVASKIAPQLGDEGLVQLYHRRFHVIKVDGAKMPKWEAQLIQPTLAAPATAPAKLYSMPAPITKSWGAAILTPTPDPKGNLTALSFWGSFRFGGALIWESKEPTVIPAGMLRFTYRMAEGEKWPMRLVLRAAVSSRSGSSRILGVSSVLSKTAEAANGEWVTEELAIRRSPDYPDEPVHQIWLESADASRNSPANKPIKLVIGDLEWVSGDGSFSDPTGFEPNLQSSDPMERTLALSKETDPKIIESGLKDPHDRVKVQALELIKAPFSADLETLLIDMSRSWDTRVSQRAIARLSESGTERAWDAIKRTMEIGPAEHNRLFAIQALQKRNDDRLAAPLAGMFIAKDWQTRLAATTVLGAMKAKENALILVVFLQEVDPAVRANVCRLANMEVDQVCRRVLWSAVNDESEFVRTTAYLALASSPIENFAAEGRKGVRDDSWGVRLEVTKKLPATEANRSVFQIAVTDREPMVRAAALYRFAELPGETKVEEIQNVLSDEDPRVKKALEFLREKKKISGDNR